MLKRSEQLAVGFLVLLALLAAGLYTIGERIAGKRRIDIEQATPLEARFEVDINQAEWPELVQLPGIGETIARRIVDERVAGGPYADYDDLRRRVKNVGPITVERIKPYLAPIPPVQNVADFSSEK